MYQGIALELASLGIALVSDNTLGVVAAGILLLPFGGLKAVGLVLLGGDFEEVGRSQRSQLDSVSMLPTFLLWSMRRTVPSLLLGVR